MPSQDPDILILALARWDAPYSSTAFSLAKELSQDQRVFLIDNPFTFKDLFLKGFSPPLKRRWKALLCRQNTSYPLPYAPNLFTCTPPLMLPINWLAPGKVYNFFAKVNQNRMKRFLQNLLKQKQIPSFHLLNIFNPFYSFESLKSLQANVLVYYSVDKISHSLYISKHGPRLEKEITQEADFCLSTSSQLQKDLASFTEKEVFLLPNAADVALFQQARQADTLPEAYARIEKPIVLYVGAIGFRLDYELLASVTQTHQDKHFVFIGPKGNGYDDRLEQRPNVSFLGSIPQKQLPPYFHYASCGIIPFKINALTAAIYPLKIHEYLAAGLPVVSTPFSLDIQSFHEQIHLSSSPEHFGKLLVKTINDVPFALKEDTHAIVEAHSWKSRSDQLKALLTQFTSG